MTDMYDDTLPDHGDLPENIPAGTDDTFDFKKDVEDEKELMGKETEKEPPKKKTRTVKEKEKKEKEDEKLLEFGW